MNDEEHYPVPLWPTPWYLRFLGFKAWRYRQQTSMKKIYWVYVDSVHEIKEYTPIR